MIRVIARHELARLAVSPLAWGLAAASQLLGGLFFNAYVQGFLQTQAEAHGRFSVTAQVLGPHAGVLALVFILLLPLLAMGTLAGERRAGSLPLLLTAPLRPSQIVLGKYLGQLGFLTLLWLLLALMPASLLLAGNLDPGQALLTGLGLWLLAATVLAIAVAASAWCRQPATAAGLSLAILLPLWLVESATLHVHGLALFGAETLSLLGHFRALREGLLDSRDPLYYLVLIGLALALACAGLRRDMHARRAWLPPLGAAVLLALFILPLNQLLHVRRDVSANGWNSLSAPTRAVLAALPEAPTLRAYFADPEQRLSLARALAPFQAERPDLRLDFADAALAERDGLPTRTQLSLRLGARQEALPWPFQGSAEAALTPVLARLARGTARWIVFVQGHGERSPLGNNQRDVSDFRRRLEARGLVVRTLSLSNLAAIPDNTAVLVLASPETSLPEADQRLITDYLARGGALLVLLEPEPAPMPTRLLNALGVTRLAGTVIDMAAYRRGTPHPAIVLVDKPEDHALTRPVNSLIALPWAAALESDTDNGWKATPLLRSAPSTWLELGRLDGAELRQDADFGEASGPFTLALALERGSAEHPQRAVVVGDGNFLSNSALGNYGNAGFGLAAVDWLTRDEQAMQLPTSLRVDPELRPNALFSALTNTIFPWVLSSLMLAVGLLIPVWRRRG